MSPQNGPVVKQQMLIRKPVEEVFEAFLNPAVTSKFWFTKSSGRLEAGKMVRWEWEMYGISAEVRVKAVEPQRRILVEWDEPPMSLEWQFTTRSDRTTLVTICNWGFQGTDEMRVAQALDAMGGFSFLLAGAKAYLEHGVRLNLTQITTPRPAKGVTSDNAISDAKGRRIARSAVWGIMNFRKRYLVIAVRAVLYGRSFLVFPLTSTVCGGPIFPACHIVSLYVPSGTPATK